MTRYISFKYSIPALLLAITYGTASAGTKHLSRQELAQKAAMAVQLNAQAEKQMIRQMQTVRRWLVEFNDRYGHFPNSTQEIDFFQDKMGKLLPPNPYVVKAPPPEGEQSMLAKTVNLLDPGPVEAPRIRLIVDPSMTAGRLDMIAGYLPDNWGTSPGNITIVTNAADLCALVAGGCDGSPIRNESSGKVLLFTVRQAL